MKLFLDTADLDQIKEALRWGIIDGVTTNPTWVAKSGRNPKDLYPEILAIVNGDVSLETVGLDADTIVEEGRQLAKLADNVVVKVPVVMEGLIAVRRLAAEGIRTNVTVTFQPIQALLAAKAGATYISPFVGRLDSVGHHGMKLVEQIMQMYGHYGYATEIIVAAVRHPIHVLDAALVGAHVCTLAFDVMKTLLDHPLTDAGIEQFLTDWRKVPQ